ncbi:MAG: hypothetical protein ACOX60_01010 [Massiliimalia sp.]|jgi:glucan-binding YG repeat protein
MKDSKKLLAALLAVMMAASSSAVVFADGVEEKTEEKDTITATNLTPATVAAADPVSAGAKETTVKEISNSQELAEAIENQADNQIWNLKAGETYNLTKELMDTYQNIYINGSANTGFVFPITANNITINGNGATITSDYNPNSGNWAQQNFITVAGNDVKINKVKIKANPNSFKNEQEDYMNTCNKAIEVLGSNFELTDSTLENSGPRGSGSIYFGNGANIGTAKITDVTMESWIVAKYFSEGTLTLTGVTQNFVGNSAAGTDYYFGVGTAPETEKKVTVTNHTIIVDEKVNLTEQVIPQLKDNTTVELTKGTYEVGKMLDIAKDNVTLNLNGSTITASDSFQYTYDNDRHLVQVSGDDVTVKNGTIKTKEDNKNGVNVYLATGVHLSDLTIDHSTALTGAPLIVNGSEVTVDGNLGLITGQNSWYGINVAKGKDVTETPKLTFAGGSKINFEDKSNKNLAIIESESDSEVSSKSEYIQVNKDGSITLKPNGNNNNNGGGSIGVPGTGTPIGTGTWKQSPVGWWYQNVDGTYPANQWKYLDSGKGYKAWYLFNQNGYITFGWQKVGNTWYYMNRSGEMQTGWQFINNKWYYLNSNGAMATGWVKDGNKWYFMNKDGSMHFGWLSWAGYWYHLDSHGVMSTGWKQVNGKWYYMYAENGRMAANTTTPDGYRVGPDGAWIK